MGRSTLHRGNEIRFNAGEMGPRAADTQNTLDDVRGIGPQPQSVMSIKVPDVMGYRRPSAFQWHNDDIINNTRLSVKGKPGESRGRKVTGL